MMEHLPAADANAIASSLAVFEEAEVYIGIFAHSYGYVPESYHRCFRLYCGGQTVTFLKVTYRRWNQPEAVTLNLSSILER